MLHKFRLLLTTMLVSMILVACGSETNGDALSEDTTDTVSEVQVTEEVNAEDEPADETSTVETTSTTEDEVTEEDTDTDSEAEEAVAQAQAEAEAAEEAKKLQEATTEAEANLNGAEEIVLEKIIAVTGLKPENHSFNLFVEADYIEVEIYEKTDEAVTPLVGAYRFIPETEEILIRDYLSGEFIPYEEAE